MTQKVTKGICVSVDTVFEGSIMKAYKLCFGFGYNISIENHGNDPIQILSRHWQISDALNAMEIVDGKGVVGEKPVIKPGEKFTYNSSCFIYSPIGFMRGHFNVINFSSTKKFRVYVPEFKLCAPFALN